VKNKQNAFEYFLPMLPMFSVHDVDIRTRGVCPSGDVRGLLSTAVPVDHAVSGQ